MANTTEPVAEGKGGNPFVSVKDLRKLKSFEMSGQQRKMKKKTGLERKSPAPLSFTDKALTSKVAARWMDALYTCQHLPSPMLLQVEIQPLSPAGIENTFA